MADTNSRLLEAAGLALPDPGPGPFPVGVLKGEGVGPQLTELCVELLEAVGRRFERSFAISYGGPIGLEAFRSGGSVLSDEVCDFCSDIFARRGAILAGPGGGRFVYDMRERFDLFMKLNLLERHSELSGDTPVSWRSDAPVDILVVRENLGGLYQGQSSTRETSDGGVRIEHSFGYAEQEVARLVDAAARLAVARRGHLTVIAKDSGVPDLTRLWFNCARRAARRHDVELRTMDVDFAVYEFVSRPERFDVVAVPNCFGDIVADLGGIIAGSRGLTYGASYSERGGAVYQTNHGSAYDLAGTDSANPVGQILSVAMMLHESFGLSREADAIRDAVRRVWSEGWRTADLMASGRRLVGTSEFAARVTQTLAERAELAA